MYITGANGKLVPLSTFATLETSTEPRDLKRFQQLNAVRIQGAIPPGVSLDSALKYLEEQAAAILPRGFTVDYAGESRQLRTEGTKFLGEFLLSAVLIYLVLGRAIRLSECRRRRNCVWREHDLPHLSPGSRTRTHLERRR